MSPAWSAPVKGGYKQVVAEAREGSESGSLASCEMDQLEGEAENLTATWTEPVLNLERRKQAHSCRPTIAHSGTEQEAIDGLLLRARDMLRKLSADQQTTASRVKTLQGDFSNLRSQLAEVSQEQRHAIFAGYVKLGK
eukprot:GHVT01102664.1.p1 GENE.GHVT01102664.1~~GHVT01102664.1.p1  ORF type:complete len:138 (+),score=17.85 GHVT01102664.1:365-778(+)